MAGVALGVGPHVRGHVFLFEGARRFTPSPETGPRLLVAAAVLEGFRLAGTRWLPPSLPLWLWLPALLALALLAVRRFVGIPLAEIGLRRWRHWTTTERSYFCQ